MTNVYVVEDHPLMRQMLCSYVTRRLGLHVWGSTETGEVALEALCAAAESEVQPIHLLLVDVSLPNMSGIELIEAAHARWPELVSVMVSGHGENAYVQRALEAGAQGYVLKGNTADIGTAVQHALNGKSFVSEALYM